jgi:hypothetical protein
MLRPLNFIDIELVLVAAEQVLRASMAARTIAGIAVE